jgi:hypothetical protein
VGDDARSPAQYAADIHAAWERLAGCSAAGLQAGDGRVERFAQIAVRHPDDHRAELEAALGI